MKAKYIVQYKDSRCILIKDEALIYGTMSVTNDAESVVEDVHKRFNLTDKILYYIDTDGRVDILGHDNGIFDKFISGFDNISEFNKKYDVNAPVFYLDEYESL